MIKINVARLKSFGVDVVLGDKYWGDRIECEMIVERWNKDLCKYTEMTHMEWRESHGGKPEGLDGQLPVIVYNGEKEFRSLVSNVDWKVKCQWKPDLEALVMAYVISRSFDIEVESSPSAAIGLLDAGFRYQL